jgi:tetratricopeptide (TPR) repeat protein
LSEFDLTSYRTISRGYAPVTEGARLAKSHPAAIIDFMQTLLVAVTVCSILFTNLARSQDVGELIRKADELDKQERTDAAIETLRRAEKIRPSNPDVLVKLSQDYSDKIDASKDRSQKLASAKLCLEYAKKAVHAAPDNADAHVCLSIAYGKMTDFVDNKTKMEYSKVIKSEAEKAVELNPKNDQALLILARWNFDMATLNPILKVIAESLYGQLPPASKEKAMEYFQRAIAAAPESIIDHAQFAEALESMGKTNEARAEWLKVRQLKPTGAEDRKYVAEAEQKLQ